MPTRPPRVCGKCRRTIPHGECPHCRPEQRADTNRRRGTTTQRGYGTAWQINRKAYLREHRTCVLCSALSNVADHHPRTRRELVAAGVPDPDGWHRLRALCTPCHNQHTARTTPGGWYAQMRDASRNSTT